jgi:hypothetical protein
MNKFKLHKLKRQLSELRRKPAGIPSRKLQSLAKSLGRERSKGRGKEPTWISTSFPNARPISIPDHSGTMKKGTAANILDQLELDIFLYEKELGEWGD